MSVWFNYCLKITVTKQQQAEFILTYCIENKICFTSSVVHSISITNNVYFTFSLNTSTECYNSQESFKSFLKSRKIKYEESKTEFTNTYINMGCGYD
jgi:hypothetical protein